MKAFWSGFILAFGTGQRLLMIYFEIPLYIVLIRLMGLKWFILFEADFFGIRALNVWFKEGGKIFMGKKSVDDYANVWAY